MVFDNDFEFGASSNPEDNIPDEVWDYGMKVYTRAWEEYLEAGCPFGETDEAMLVWFSFNDPECNTVLTFGRN